jgi:hypothetical protein
MLNQKQVPSKVPTLIAQRLNRAFKLAGSSKIWFLPDGLYITASTIVLGQYGLYSLLCIPPHTHMGAYDGNKISKNTWSTWDPEVKARKMQYLIKIGDTSEYIDPTDNKGHPIPTRRPLAFINEPAVNTHANLYMDFWRPSNSSSRVVGFISGCIRIESGVELTVHYGFYFSRTYESGIPCVLGCVDTHYQDLFVDR